MRLLAGDVGGTKTLLSIFERRDEGFVETRQERYASGDYDSLDALVGEMLEGEPAIDRAAFGIAGPVSGGRCKTTNLPWEVDQAALGATLGVARVELLNDFAAVALGLESLSDSHMATLQAGRVDPKGPVAILGAGTGLGEALLVPTDAGPRVLPSEGGHVEFAPRTEVESQVHAYLRSTRSHVSVERVVSGPGLQAIYEVLIREALAAESPEVAARMKTEDPSVVIGEAALADTDAACARAVQVFLGAYGAEAGNLALKVLPTGGLFVAGGIAPRLLPLMRSGPFLDAFLDKGRMKPVLEAIRVAVITEPRVGLLGARNAAARLP